MLRVVAENDVVITTAAIPGRKAPILVTEEMVKGMAPGSVMVDLAAERGGNCELTKVDVDVVAHHVTILGPSNMPSTGPVHASQMFSRNVFNFVANLLDVTATRLKPAEEPEKPEKAPDDADDPADDPGD